MNFLFVFGHFMTKKSGSLTILNQKVIGYYEDYIYENILNLNLSYFNIILN